MLSLHQSILFQEAEVKSGSVTWVGLLGSSGSSTHISPQWSSTASAPPLNYLGNIHPTNWVRYLERTLEEDPLVITLWPITAQIGILKEKTPSALMLLIVEIRSLWASCGIEPFKFWSSSMGKTQLWPHQLHSKPGCLHFTFLAILDPKISPSPPHHSDFQKSLPGVPS